MLAIINFFLCAHTRQPSYVKIEKKKRKACEEMVKNPSDAAKVKIRQLFSAPLTLRLDRFHAASGGVGDSDL
jgi:hypothetical protein